VSVCGEVLRLLLCMCLYCVGRYWFSRGRGIGVVVRFVSSCFWVVCILGLG